ncbi:DNA polymerase III subunit delta [bacterium]|nr:DNA polymerase III subunit delta [bacterium]
MHQPIHILVGTDTFLIEREKNAIIQKVLGDKYDPLLVERYISKETPAASLIDNLVTGSLFASQKVVIVSGVGESKKDDLGPWETYFKNPQDASVLVLVADKIDKRLGIWKEAIKKNWVTEVKPPYDNKLPEWVQIESKRIGLGLTTQAIRALVDSVGNNLAGLVSALEKLQIYVLPAKQADVKEVSAVVGDFHSHTVFDLAESLGKKSVTQASRILDDLFLNGEPPVRILIMLIRHFRLLMLASENAGRPEYEMASLLGVSPFFVKDYAGQCRNFSPSKLRAIYRYLQKIDLKLKSSPLKGALWMDELTLKLCLQ